MKRGDRYVAMACSERFDCKWLTSFVLKFPNRGKLEDPSNIQKGRGSVTILGHNRICDKNSLEIAQVPL